MLSEWHHFTQMFMGPKHSHLSLTTSSPDRFGRLLGGESDYGLSSHQSQRKQEHWSNVKSPLARHEISIHLSSPKGLVVFCQWGVRGQDPGVFKAPYYEVQQAVMSTMKSIND